MPSSMPLQAETLQVAFRPFGNVQNVKVIREKGGRFIFVLSTAPCFWNCPTLADRRFWSEVGLQEAQYCYMLYHVPPTYLCANT